MNRRIASLYRSVLPLLLLPAVAGTIYGQAVEEATAPSAPARPPLPVTMSEASMDSRSFDKSNVRAADA